MNDPVPVTLKTGADLARRSGRKRPRLSAAKQLLATICVFHFLPIANELHCP